MLRIKKSSREIGRDTLGAGRVVKALTPTDEDFMLGTIEGAVAEGDSLSRGGECYKVREVREHIVIVEREK